MSDHPGALRELAESQGPNSDPTLRLLAGAIVRLQADADHLKRTAARTAHAEPERRRPKRVEQRSALKRRVPTKKGWSP